MVIRRRSFRSRWRLGTMAVLASASPAPGPRALPPIVSSIAPRVLSLVVVLAAWELYGRANAIFLSYPSAIAAAFVARLVPDIIPAFGHTGEAFALGFAMLLPLGIAIGMAMGRSRTIDTILGPYVNAFYVTPRVTLIPLLVLWLGIAFQMQVAIVVLAGIFPVIVTVYAGARIVDRDLVEVGQTFVASRAQIFRTIILPGTIPYIFTGARLGLARALGGVISAEMTVSITGVGRLLISKAQFLKMDELFAPLIVLGLASIALTSTLLWMQRRLTPWATGLRSR
ncbi:MAG TPA: hypothetical protein DCK98_06485 [Chloroflexi bacterium]|nr:hypothetical protein [Chloroflexota bacterium]HAL26967.1 hypothetical protein [Chloroflexota bacterium]